MEITKFGHSCILIDDGQTKILFDPGSWSTIPDLNVDGVIITHTHGDHYNIENVKKLLNTAVINNNATRIITNTEVKTELEKEGIGAEVVEEGASTEIGTFNLVAYGNEHAIIHPDLPKFQNTGYLLNQKIFHPGDALTLPPGLVEVLLLPISAPWGKVEEVLDYITAVKPKIVFPIHDAILSPDGASVFYRFASMWCEKINTQFIAPELNKPYAV